MRGQTSQFDCGPASLYNALWALNHEVTLHDCEKACKADMVDGTSAHQLRKAITAMGGVVEDEIAEAREVTARLMLLDHLHRGYPVIMCVENQGHWVTAVGTLGKIILVADPADNELVRAYGPGELEDLWRCPSAGRKRFWGLVVGLAKKEAK